MNASIVCKGELIDGVFRPDDKNEMTLKKGDLCAFFTDDRKEVGIDYVGPVWIARITKQ